MSLIAPPTKQRDYRKEGQKTLLKTVFLKVAHFVEENDEEKITVNDLTKKMEEFLQNSEEQAYSDVYMKKKLRDHFGDRIVITTTKKQANIVTSKVERLQ